MIRFCKKIVSFFATVLFLMKKIPNAVRGRRFLRHADPSLFFIVCPCCLGEAVFAGVAAKYVSEKQVVILLREPYKTFDGLCDRFRCIPNAQLSRDVEWYIMLTKRYSGKNYIYGHFRHDWSGLIPMRDYSITVWEDLSRNVYHIPLLAFRNCYIPVNQSADVCLADKDVVLFPYAYSITNLSQDFWIRLAARLTSAGYTVYTNISRAEKPVSGTTALVCGLDTLCAVVEHCAGCVSLRSGICDFLAVFSQVPLLIINPKGGVNMAGRTEKIIDPSENWDVSFLRDTNVYNYIFEDEKPDALIGQIVQQLQKAEDVTHES